MKKTLLTAFIIGAAICTASAQNHTVQTSATETATEQKTETKQSKEWQTLVTELKLTDDQQKKITELNKAFDERRKSVESNTTVTEEQRAERLTAMKKAQESQFLKMLTPEQQAKYKELMEAKK